MQHRRGYRWMECSVKFGGEDEVALKFSEGVLDMFDGGE